MTTYEDVDNHPQMTTYAHPIHHEFTGKPDHTYATKPGATPGTIEVQPIYEDDLGTVKPNTIEIEIKDNANGKYSGLELDKTTAIALARAILDNVLTTPDE